MAVIPVWLKGRHWTAMTFTGQSVAADGTLSDGTSKVVIAQVRNCRLRSNPTKENITPTPSTIANQEILEENNTFECEVLLKKNEGNPLAAIATAFDIVKAVATWGKETWTFYGSRGEFETGVQGKGANTERLMLDQVDIGSANPVLVVAP